MPSLSQLNDAVMAFREEYPDAVVTVVVDATFGHRIDKKEAAEFDAAVAHNELVAPPAGRHRPRRRLRAEHRQQGRRPDPQQRLVPGVPRRLPVAVRRGSPDRRQAGAVRRLGLRRAAPGQGTGQPQVATGSAIAVAAPPSRRRCAARRARRRACRCRCRRRRRRAPAVPHRQPDVGGRCRRAAAEGRRSGQRRAAVPRLRRAPPGRQQRQRRRRVVRLARRLREHRRRARLRAAAPDGRSAAAQRRARR